MKDWKILCFNFVFRALVQTLEKSKKKYQSRLKKLEQQMLGMVERHTAQVWTSINVVCDVKEIKKNR